MLQFGLGQSELLNRRLAGRVHFGDGSFRLDKQSFQLFLVLDQRLDLGLSRSYRLLDLIHIDPAHAVEVSKVFVAHPHGTTHHRHIVHIVEEGGVKRTILFLSVRWLRFGSRTSLLCHFTRRLLHNLFENFHFTGTVH